MHKRKLLNLTSLLILVALPAVVFWQRQAVFDWYRLRGYNPPTQISQLALDTGMNDDMKRLFYVYHPELQDKAAFNTSCRDNELTIVLGCYVNGRGIYLLDVTDDRLNGVEQVTAAHESLHAAYARLSKKDKVRIDSLTKSAYDTLASQRIKDTVELYRKQDASIVPNELHSILGTEMRILPPELEMYYAEYFTDRLKVVGYSELYEQAFTQRKQQVEAFDAQLASLKKDIEDLQAKLDTDEAALGAERARMTALRENDQTDEYNAAVPGYNRRIGAFNANISKLTSFIAQYNEIVPRRNAIASEEKELVSAIDSRETVPAAQ